MENIFENAYFGKPYKTRDGRKALYLKKYKHGEICNELVVEYKDITEGRKFYLYKDDGSFYHRECDEDIVSEWKEETNEEELDRIVKERYPFEDGLEESHYNSNIDKLREAFKDGYRKADESVIVYFRSDEVIQTTFFNGTEADANEYAKKMQPKGCTHYDVLPYCSWQWRYKN